MYRPRSTADEERFRVFAPHPALRGQVSCYFSVMRPEGAPPVRTIPDGCVDVVFDGRRVHVNGVQEKAHVFAGAVRLLGARFLPGCALPFLDVPLGELSQTWLPLTSLMGPWAEKLEARLVEAATPAAQVMVLDELLLERLRQAPLEDRVRRAVTLVMERPVTLPELGREAGASPRNLGRLFHTWVGVGPKRLLRIMRVQRTLTRLGTDWAELALEMGYADQAHLVREFSEIVGTSPTRFVRDLQMR